MLIANVHGADWIIIGGLLAAVALGALLGLGLSASSARDFDERHGKE